MKLKDLGTYDAALYSRLSRDDGKKGKKESMSIENQKQLLVKYARERGWAAKQYSDDGWSGMSFDRPRYNELKRDIEAKRINCVIVKCLDRLGRGSRTEDEIDFFKRKKIRFIAIQEGIDTLEGYDEVFDVLNAFNGMYPKTVSKKVKHVKQEAAKEGKFMNSVAPYGYMKSPLDKHKLIIDEEAAAIVRRIFKERADGDSARFICERLTKEGIDCPSFYHYRKFGKGIEVLIQREKVNAWNATTVSSQLLRNQVYLGHMVSGKREVVCIKDNIIEATDKDDWIIVPNTHTPIISQELWDRVHQNLNDKQRVYRTKETGEVSLFAGVLKCADCGAPLAYTAKKLAAGVKGVYKCSRYNNTSGLICTTHYIDEAALCEAVLTDLRQYAVLATSEREKLASYLMLQLRKTQTRESSAISSQITVYENRLLELKAEYRSLYNDKRLGKIDEDILSELMDDVTKERVEIEGQLPKLRQELAEIKGTAENIDEWLDKISAHLEIRTLDRDIIQGLVDRIIVGEKVRVKGMKTTQEITINYRFIGTLLANANEDAPLVS